MPNQRELTSKEFFGKTRWAVIGDTCSEHGNFMVQSIIKVEGVSRRFTISTVEKTLPGGNIYKVTLPSLDIEVVNLLPGEFSPREELTVKMSYYDRMMPFDDLLSGVNSSIGETEHPRFISTYDTIYGPVQLPLTTGFPTEIDTAQIINLSELLYSPDTVDVTQIEAASVLGIDLTEALSLMDYGDRIDY